MTRRVENPIVDLAELFILDLKPRDDDAGTRDVSLHLRFGEVELVDGDVVFTVSMQRAYVGLDTIGLSVDPTRRFGEVIKDNEVVVERQREEKKSTSLKGRVGAAVKSVVTLPLAVDAEANASHERSFIETKSVSDKETRTRVTPRGGDKWEIVEPDGKALDGLYLDNAKVLCRLLPRKGANQKSVTAQVYVKQRDLIFKREGESLLRRKLSKNEERMLGILIAKVLRTQAVSSAGKSAGYLVLSEMEVEYES